MTPEKRYEILCGLVRKIAALDYADDAAAGADFAEKVIGNPQKWENSVYFPAYADVAKLMIDALQSMDKQNTGAGRVAALNRIYKSAVEWAQEDHKGVFQSGERWAICDGYRFVRLNKKPESIPECKGGLDLDRCIPKDAECADPVQLPNVSEIKAAIASLKAKHGKAWKHKPFEALPGWWCNPQYLLDMVQALPGGTAFQPMSYRSPLYYRGEDGDALLLPIRHKDAL